MNIELIRTMLEKENLSHVSRETGISRVSLMAIRDGFSKDIKVSTMDRLEIFFNNKK